MAITGLYDVTPSTARTPVDKRARQLLVKKVDKLRKNSLNLSNLFSPEQKTTNKVSSLSDFLSRLNSGNNQDLNVLPVVDERLETLGLEDYIEERRVIERD